MLGKVFARFVEKSPISVMVRGTLERVLGADQLDAWFARTAQKQSTRTWLCSTVYDVLSQVVFRIKPSVRAAYREREDEGAVSLIALPPHTVVKWGHYTSFAGYWNYPHDGGTRPRVWRRSRMPLSWWRWWHRGGNTLCHWCESCPLSGPVDRGAYPTFQGPLRTKFQRLSNAAIDVTGRAIAAL
jgi:hypothetical protein